jgi:hypothetical protein
MGMKRETVAVACAVILMVSACSKDPLKNLSDEESRIYITQRDSTVNFANFNTFSIADSVAYINNNQSVARFTNVDAQFIEAIKSEMQQRGFVFVPRNQNPDIGITVSRVYSTYQGIVDYTDYYYDYWDPFYWGYSGSSYFFPSYYGVYQVTEGALSIDMLNLKDAPATNQIKSVWNGFIRGSGIFSSENVNGQVEALFIQSPYLESNP